MKTCPSTIFTEVFYLIALVLLHFYRRHDIPSKFHYQVFHAISFFENEFQIGCEPVQQSPSKQKGQSSLKEFGFTKKSSIQLTAEQARIAHHQLSSVSKLFQSSGR